jgi:hypothetical protein
VESLAVMVKWNPFFERAGMTRVESKQTNLKVLQRLSPSKLEVVQQFALN